MTIMVFALNLDPAYVVARDIGLVLFMPAVAGFVPHRGVTANHDVNVEED
jgi:hypothetical protein